MIIIYREFLIIGKNLLFLRVINFLIFLNLLLNILLNNSDIIA